MKVGPWLRAVIHTVFRRHGMLPVPYQLDPTVIPTSNGSVSLWRSIATEVGETSRVVPSIDSHQHVESLLEKEDEAGTAARYLLATGNATYHRAFTEIFRRGDLRWRLRPSMGCTMECTEAELWWLDRGPGAWWYRIMGRSLRREP